MTDPIPWLILLPLFWATGAFFLGPGRGARPAIAALAMQLVLALLLGWQVAASGARTYAIGGWRAPLGIDLVADGLSAVMVLMTQAVMLPLAVYARTYFAHHRDGVHYFWPLCGYLVAAMNALFLAADVFNLYVTLELMGLASVGLVAASGGIGPTAAALRYLLAALLGSGAYLLGVALLYGTYGTVSLSLLTAFIATPAPAAVLLAAGLMLTGLLLKTALFPFHFWLPPAHGGAPPPVSALLSSLVVKGSFYLIVRLWFVLFGPVVTPAAAQLLGILGAAAILWGSLMALTQVRLKMLVAYSTVAQIGYLFLLFPLISQTGFFVVESALQGIVMQAVSHALAKAAMFAAAGAIILSLGVDDINRLGGVSGRLPLTLFTFALAGVTLMGLPPSGGFIAKWLLIDAALAHNQWGWILVLIAGGLLTAAYVFKVLRQAFLPTHESVDSQPLPRTLEWPGFLLATASLALGIRAGELLEVLGAP